MLWVCNASREAFILVAWKVLQWNNKMWVEQCNSATNIRWSQGSSPTHIPGGQALTSVRAVQPTLACRAVLQVQKYAERYFGGWRGAADALPSRPVLQREPSARPLGGPLYHEEVSRAGPAALHAYYRAGLPGKDSVTLDAIR